MSADETLSPEPQPAPQDDQTAGAETAPASTSADAVPIPLPGTGSPEPGAEDEASSPAKTMEYRTPSGPLATQGAASVQWLLNTDPQSPEATQLLARHFGLPAAVVGRFKNECIQRYQEEQVANLTPEQIVRRYLDRVTANAPVAPHEINPEYVLSGMRATVAQDGVPPTPTPPESATMKEAGFIAEHPLEAWRIGTADGLPHDISSNASRFATMGTAPGTKNHQILSLGYENMGGESNAFRHALWQAEITNRYGFPDAEQAGNSHEDDPLPDLMQREFPLPDPKFRDKYKAAWQRADTVLDLLNNPIGRFLGGTAPDGVGMRNLAGRLLDHYHEKGLWDAVPEGNTLVVKKIKLSDDKYLQLKDALQRKDDNGEWVK